MRTKIFFALAALILVVAPASAQLEPGWGVYARLYYPLNASSAAIPGGLVLYHPYLGKNAYITGLPADLTWEGRTGYGGANAILVRDADGSLLVGNAYGEKPAIYHIALSGTVGTVKRIYEIGTNPVAVMTASIDQMAWLPGNKVLFTHIGVDRPGLQQPTGLAVLDLETGDVTPLTITNFPAGRYINACAVDQAFTTIYIGTYGNGGGLYSLPIDGGPATAVPGYATMASSVQQLAMGYDGMIYLAPGWGIGKILQIEPATGNTVEIANVLGAINALCVEPVTGDLLFMRIACGDTPPIPAGNSAAYYWRNAGEGMVLAPGMNGYEAPSGVAVRSSLLTYGKPDPRSTQEWRIHPNPGWAPRIGNKGFSLTTDSPCRDHGLLMIGLAPANKCWNHPFFGSLLVDPFSLVAIRPLAPPAKTFTVPFPICAKMKKMNLYAQVISLGKKGWPKMAGGPGLQIHIYE